MEIFFSDTFDLPLPEKHRFPMSKYRLLRQRITESDQFNKHSTLRIPRAATNEQLKLAHDREYVERVIAGRLSDLEVRRIGFPWSTGLLERSRRSVGASISAARSALSHRTSVNLAGGTHHAFADAGQGYCVFNDAVVAARVLQAEGLVKRVLFADLDVHQGNGTAAIARNDESLFAFSMHCGKNFPYRKTEGDLDVSLPERTTDADYLAALDHALQTIERQFPPDLVIYLAGADPFVGDRLGHLSLTKNGLEIRDRRVFEFCQRRGIPVAIAMSGGYAPDVQDIVDIHFKTVSIALEYYLTGSAESSAKPE